jgi:hypothetical protein
MYLNKEIANKLNYMLTPKVQDTLNEFLNEQLQDIYKTLVDETNNIEIHRAQGKAIFISELLTLNETVQSVLKDYKEQLDKDATW